MGRYVSYRRKRLNSILHMWRLTRAEAGLDNRVTPYSINTVLLASCASGACLPSKSACSWPLPHGSAATTSIYAPYEPGFLDVAVEAIEGVMVEVRKYLERAQVDNLQIDPADLADHTTKRRHRCIGERKYGLPTR